MGVSASTSAKAMTPWFPITMSLFASPGGPCLQHGQADQHRV